MITRQAVEIRQNYNEIADICRKTSEPIFLINNGEEDLVVMDVKSYSRREKMLKLQKELLEIEEERLKGNEGCTLDELEAYLDEVIERAS
ncbi:MAG: type II toxin-antitoxin system Phd/YefM family antitoxin [Oscillospiraceae bacterium]|nr:type II toxin-antitoxin system Phd/YefM family antitoxin [Oscillospiraceae bacterium]